VSFPEKFDFYGKLKASTIASMTVETFFRKKFIDHTKYYLDDKEHYNKSFHDLIASKYIPWLKTV
jgi:hypothetical protein